MASCCGENKVARSIRVIAAVMILGVFNVDVASACAEYKSKITSCTPYSCTYKHPVGNVKAKKTIVGIRSGKCVTKDELPNGLSMTCRFDQEDLDKLNDIGFLNKSMNDGTCVTSGEKEISTEGMGTSVGELPAPPELDPGSNTIESGGSAEVATEPSGSSVQEAPSSGGIVKCTDKDGKVEYRKGTCPEGAKEERL